MKKRVRRWSADDLDRIRQIKDYIIHHLGEELLIRNLAVRCAMNEKKLNESFLYLNGIRIAPFIRQKRMEKAHQLLVQTDFPIKEINVLCGYPNLSSFHRAFLEYYAYTPASLRNVS